jgi:xylan 1,4-beta-xylosidase
MSEAIIRNPILPGFNPDPSVCRHGDDYYIATSTFEWYPGVQIHHSRDLVHWRLLTRPLDRLSLLSMEGNPNSGGIWAPCLSRANGLFWLIYTDVKTFGHGFFDTHNYLTTAPTITGPWSEPVHLNSSGFDPSLFHDEDGRAWLVNMRTDYRPGRNVFNGIVLQEYDHAAGRLVGPIRRIFTGSGLGCTEGPHLYRRSGWYYLMTAEGGTGYDHAVTMARAQDIGGPYEVDPANPILTSRNAPELELQKAGHASLVETPGGWYMVHLCGRPLAVNGQRRCMLGRETAIQKVEWTVDGWLRLVGGGRSPQVEVSAPGLLAHPFPAEPIRDEFTGPTLARQWQHPRQPVDTSWCSLIARPGWLRLVGRESPQSRHRQSLVARRIQHFSIRAQTRVDMASGDFQHLAGLMALYDSGTWYYLRLSYDEVRNGLVLGIVASDESAIEMPADSEVILDRTGPVHLRLEIDRANLTFSWSWDADTWHRIGPVFDASRLSDEGGKDWRRFTGSFVGLACHDMSGQRRYADFDYFDYEGR